MLELPVLPRHIFLEQGEANLQTSPAGPAWPRQPGCFGYVVVP